MNAQTKQLQLFKYNNNAVRTIAKNDGSIWFVAVDVCRVLGLQNIRQNMNALDDDEKMTVYNTYSHSGQRGGAQYMTFISESGLYSLIFKSRKDEARDFSRWVRREVLPSIRQHGFYVNDKKINSLNSQDEIINEVLTELKFTREENKRLRAKIEQDKQRVALSNLLVGTAQSLTMQEASIFLRQHGIKNIGQNGLFKLFREMGLLGSRKGKQWNRPVGEAVNKGYFCLQINGGPSRVTTMITHKFLMKILDEFTREQLPIVFMLNESDKEDSK